MRVIFSKGKQNDFIERILSKLSVGEAAKFCSLSERTIRDWRREKFSVDLNSLRKLCRKTGIPFPVDIELKDDYWYTANSSSTGGIAAFKKYGRVGGDPEYRKKKWYEWWDREGKHRYGFIGVCGPIRKPNYSKDLAEFIGVVLGDGSITQRQITVTLHREDDREYGEFVTSLIKKLFDVPVGLHHNKKYPVINFTVSRSELVRFCVEKLGLKRGNKIKQQVDIPDWVKQNKLYSKSCVRGLVDTDGCVFTHSYKVNKKLYSYKKLSFTSYSEPLRQSVFNILRENKMNPRLSQNRDVRLDSIRDMQRYFKVISSHNPKHLKKYKK